MDVAIDNVPAADDPGTSPHELVPEEIHWIPPILSYSQYPECVFLLHDQFSASSSASKSAPREHKNNFHKGIKWSPDGSCFLLSSEDARIRLYDTPWSELEDRTAIDPEKTTSDSELAPAVSVTEGETIYDFGWYPAMSSYDAASCVFASSCRDHPIHLWDAVTGELRCSYRAYNQMDEIVAAYSLAFNPQGSKMVAGYSKTIRMFDTCRPGREYVEMATAPSKKEGQSGILGCITFNPDHSSLFAVGSYSSTVGIYDDSTLQLVLLLHGHTGGVTQVQFSRDGNYLYSGARKDSEIICWDIRNTAGILYRLERDTSSTNQRIAFDIEPAGRHLATGGQDGSVRVYDLSNGEFVSSFKAADGTVFGVASLATFIEPGHRLGSDTVNGVSYHPLVPLFLTSSGQRRFDVIWEDSDEELTGEDRVLSYRPTLSLMENCMAMWRFEPESMNMESSGVDFTAADGREALLTEI